MMISVPPPLRASRPVVLVVLAALLAGCTGTPDRSPTPDGRAPDAALPSAAELLDRSAEAMRAVSTVHLDLDLDVDASLPSIPVRSASVSVTADGAATGSATVVQDGAPVERAFVVTGGGIYVADPAGGFSGPVPLQVAGEAYDPTTLLDPDRGFARILDTATPGATQAREPVDGTDTYRVPATFPAEAAAVVVPGSDAPVDGVVWIDTSTFRLVRIALAVPGGTSGGTAPVTLLLGAYDVPVVVEPPS